MLFRCSRVSEQKGCCGVTFTFSAVQTTVPSILELAQAGQAARLPLVPALTQILTL